MGWIEGKSIVFSTLGDVKETERTFTSYFVTKEMN